jgi:ribosome-binding protein aMBF1 (putative translation factor)
MMSKISPIGTNWSDYKETLLTPRERHEIDLRIEVISAIINARNEEGISQKDLEKRSGVKQPVIARMEKGQTDPRLSTLLKVLEPLGKTLAVVSKTTSESISV